MERERKVLAARSWPVPKPKRRALLLKTCTEARGQFNDLGMRGPDGANQMTRGRKAKFCLQNSGWQLVRNPNEPKRSPKAR